MLEIIQVWDASALLWIQENLRNTFFDAVLPLYSTMGDAGLLWMALSALMLCFPKTRKAGLLALCAMALGLICNNLILKHLVARQRPWLVVENLLPLLEAPDPLSFPSGHTCAAFAAAGIWCRTLPGKGLRAIALLLAVLMGVSRLYVGVHFPTDVLAGMVVGLFCSWVVWRLALLVEKKRQLRRKTELD